MNRVLFPIGALAAVLVIAGGAFQLGRSTAGHAGMPAASAAASAGATGERKVLYWHDPMVPGHRFDKPGKSPFMDMPLQPVYADEAADSGVKISPQVRQNLGIRTALVKKMPLDSSFDAVGTVQFDERLSVAVQTRTAGYLERLAVRAPMERVARGQVLGTVFAPEWLGPLHDVVALKRAGASPELLAAARERTRALSIPPELLRQAEEDGTAQARYAIVAPAAGVVAELGVREGMAVSPGMTLFRIAGLRRGQKVSAVLQADPSQAFAGTLQEILPQVNATTRTLQARFEVDNPGGRLVPGMLLRVQVAGPATTRLVVPAEGVIRTGTRAVAIVRRSDGLFEPREVKPGADRGDVIEIVEGLAEGDEVVVSGQFLVDSEARLRSVLGSMAAPPSTFAAQGTVEAVEADSITITHGPVPELKWPPMTMGFGKPDPKAFPGVKPGDTVRFEFRRGGPMDYELVTVQPAGAAK